MNREEYVDFAAFDLIHLTGLSRVTRVTGEMNSLTEQFYHRKEAREELEKEKKSLLKITGRELKNLRKKLGLHKDKLNKIQDINQCRLFGELLMANLHRLEKGVSTATLENFYDPGNNPVCIPLDPKSTPLENAKTFFKKYNKNKNTLKKAKEMIKETEEEIDYLTGVETSVQMAASVEDLLEIKAELTEQKYLAAQESNQKIKKEKYRPELLTFNSSDGFTIIVGKNNKQNDYLTMRLARDNDLWLHAKNIPGAHVIIRTDGRSPSPAAISEAACLAAYYSRSRWSQNVPVDYTWRKNVFKPRGAKPGYVIYKEQHSITANPDQNLVELLKNPPPTGQ